MSYSVYKHTFPNGKVYIGITSQKPNRRWNNGNGYLNKNKKGVYTQPLIARAILKYEWNNIQHEILFEELSKEEAEQKEIELIACYKSNQRDYGYNIANGGNCVGTVSEETKQKLKESKIGDKNPFYGKHHSEETKQKLKERNSATNHWNYGKHHSKETKNKISESHKGKKISEKTKKKISELKSGINNNFYGKHHTEESKEKIRNHKSKKVYCIETNIVYNSALIAKKKTEICNTSIGRVCNGKQKTAGGYHWEFI